MAQNFVSIIILTSRWEEQGRLLDKCLQGIYQQSFREFEIILVTNGLGKSQVNSIRNRHSSVKIIENEENKGCAGGRNQGIQKARGNYIATLDDDMVPDNRWLEELIRWASKDERVGMLASKILFSSNPNIIDCAGVEISKDGNVYGSKGLTIDDGSGLEQIEEVFCPSGGAAFYKREVFEEVGLFDEDYFIYYEEVDLAFRARLVGWQCLYVPQAVLFHHHAWSLGHESNRKIFLLERNKILTILKDWPLKYMIYYAPLIAAYDIFADGYYILKKKGFSRFKAKISALRQLPRVLRERSKIHCNRRISYADMNKFWGPYYSPWFIYQRRRRLNNILKQTTQ
jgi:GT2 family glycosyltransferase